jgi:diacylglycerol kinase family enzyme
MNDAEPDTAIAPRRRAAALGALLAGTAALVTAVVGLRGDLGRAVLAGIAVLLVVALVWTTTTRRGTARRAAGVGLLVAIALLLVTVLTAEGHGLLVIVVLALLAGSAAFSRYALHRDRTSLQAAPTPGAPVGPAVRGALIMNLKSGGGKAERFHLEDEARSRGIEAIVLRPGDDLLQLARDAIERGADVVGMAGGDGSQALVASVAMQSDVPLVCIPAGTRNHFALDLGLDRDDVVGALDAFGAAVERRIDLASVGDRVFVNNVSLGVYAKIVQSEEYRDAKRQTTAKLLPDLLGPDADPFDLRFSGPDATEHTGAQIIQVSNNPYVLTRLGGFGTRARLDTGQLGVMTAEVHSAAEAAQLVAAEAAGRIQRFRGVLEWATPEFVVDSDTPIEAGVDGEALRLDPPLRFRSLPGALRVRIPTSAPGRSPAALAPPSLGWSVVALFRAVAGRATPIDEDRR